MKVVFAGVLLLLFVGEAIGARMDNSAPERTNL